MKRWLHIVENHDDLAGFYDDVLRTVEDPDLILSGYGGALIAVKTISRSKSRSVVYRELSSKDGFIVTAYFSSRLGKGSVQWRKERT